MADVRKIAVFLLRIDGLEELANIHDVAEFEDFSLLGWQAKTKEHSLKIIFEGVAEEKTIAGKIAQQSVFDPLIAMQTIDNEDIFL